MRLLLAALVAASGARAGSLPGKGEGTIELHAGGRWVPNGGFLDDQARAGYTAFRRLLTPGFTLGLGYAPEADLLVKIDIGYGIDRIYMTPGTFNTRSIQIVLGGSWAFLKRPWMTVYGGGGLGYSLNTLIQNAAQVEANSTAGYLCLGLRFPLLKNVALVVEERYTLAFAGLPGTTGPLIYGGSATSINAGGNLLSAGFMFHYTDSEEKERPYHPSRR